MQSHIKDALNQSHKALVSLMENQTAIENIEKAAELLVNCFENGGRVVSCGNGGSMCDAMHFAEELSGKFRKERPPLAAMSISDPSYMSCTGNDYGFDYVFSRFVEAHCRKGDLLLAISTSGTSKNVLKAVEAANKSGAKVICLTGKDQCELGDMADCHIGTPGGSGFADRVQELHIKCIHILIELVERKLFKSTY